MASTLNDVQQLMLSKNDDDKFVAYLSELSSSENVKFKLPWNQVIIRNYDIEGELVSMKNNKSSEIPWILLNLKKFSCDSFSYYIWVCSECNTMDGINSLSEDQKPSELVQYICWHSKVAYELFLHHVNNDILQQDHFPEDDVLVLLEKSAGMQPLIAVRSSGKSYILSTRGRATTPKCSSCSNVKCQHYKKYEKFLKDQQKVLETPVIPNSQGREQTNSILDKCLGSLQQKNYQHFMRWCIMFFAIRNLGNMKLV